MAIYQNESVFFSCVLFDEQHKVIKDMSNFDITFLLKTTNVRRTVLLVTKPELYIDEDGEITFTLSPDYTKDLEPGRYSVELKIVDMAGNVVIGESQIFNLLESNFAKL